MWSHSLFFVLPGMMTTPKTKSLPPAMAIGEGTLPAGIPDADPDLVFSNGASFGLALAVVVCGLVVAIDLVTASQAPPPEEEEKKKYVLRWTAAKTTRFENLGVGDVAQEGLNSRSFDSLEEMNAVAKNIDNLDMPYSTYSVKGKKVDQLKSFDRKTQKENARGLQAIWDEELTELAEDEAASSRGPLDEEWTLFRQRNLELTRDVKESGFDVEIVRRGDDEDEATAPCRLCNGKGYRIIFGEESGPCERCRGSGKQKSPMSS